MGLFTKLGETRMKDPVKGTLRVVSCGLPNARDTAANFRLEGVVTGDGVEATAVIHRGMAMANKWPQPGDELPVTVDRSKPERLVIRWDEVPKSKQVAMATAGKLAADIRAGGRPQGGVTKDHNKSRQMNDEAILGTGKPGTAIVVQVAPSDEPEATAGTTSLHLTLTVTVDGRPPSRVEKVFAVPDDKVPTVMAGALLPIKANLAAANLVAIDWAQRD